MIKLRKSEGFSLVELMIVVAIMAILAAIAIPSFMKFSMKAKTSEATQNLGAIRTGEEGYRSENDDYLACPGGTATAYPAAIPPASGTLWVDTAAGAFPTIGFQADGKVRYRYAVTVTNPTDGPPQFVATAEGDLDEDGTSAVYTLNTSDTANYPKATLAPAGEF